MCPVDVKHLRCDRRVPCSCPIDDLTKALSTDPEPQFVLLVAPDPEHTHLGLFFDRQVEAFDQAAQQAGYEFEMAAMPWTKRVLSDHPDLAESTREKDFQDKREEFPGIIRFRHPGATPLVAFVIGERPTAGVNADQFKNATEYVRAHSSSSVLHVIGPTFSGSLSSLDRLFEHVPFDVVIVDSGTVSGLAALQNARARWKGNARIPRVVLRTFQEPDCYLINATAHFALSNGYATSDVTLVTEEETAYGNLSRNNECSEDIGHVLYFPREISHLRAAYQRDVEQSASTDNAAAPRSTLKTDLTDPGDDDTVAPTALSETPLSQEGVLLNIAADLEKTRARFVVVRATNPTDTVFLAKYLRTAYPPARIVTIGTDLLFRRESDDPHFRGLLAIGAYSLIPDVDESLLKPPVVSDLPTARREFPSSYSVGSFNATLASLNSFNAPFSCLGSTPCETIPEAPYAQYTWPTLAGGNCVDDRLGAPPVWLVVLGARGYWPVDFATVSHLPRQEQAGSCGASTARDVEGLPLSWKLLAVSTFALMIAFGLLFRYGSAGSPAAARANFAPIPNKSRAKVLAWTTVLFSVLAILTIAPLARWIGAGRLDAFGIATGCSLGAATVFMMWSAVIGLCRREARDLAIATGVLVGVAVVASILWTALAPETISEHATIYRILHVTSGVSPVTPVLFLLAAGLWRAWYSVTGLSYLDSRRPRLPAHNDVLGSDKSSDPRLDQLTEEANKNLLAVMDPWNTDRRVLSLAGACISVPLLTLDYWHPVRAIDGVWFERLYAAGLLLVCFGLFLSLFRLVVVWTELRKLLVALNALPLQRAFKDLEGFSWRPLWRPTGRPLTDSSRYLARLSEQLTALANMGVVSRRVACTFALRQAMLAKTSEHHEPRTVERFSLCRRRVGRLTGVFLRDLLHTWSREGEKRNARVALEERFIALVYANFIAAVMARMRTLVLCVTGTFVCIALSFASYVFEPKQAYDAALIMLLLLLMSVLVVIFGRMHQNTILSLLTTTKPGELGSDFWVRIGSALAIPVISLLAVQFPELSHALFSWVEPALRAVK
jgi:hypothetical protein